MFGVVLVGFLVSGASLVEAASTAPPSTPRGLAPCLSPMTPVGAPLGVGERLTYAVDILGIGVGEIHLGARAVGEAGTEYRAHVEPRRFLSSLLRVEGEATTSVPNGMSLPTRSRLHYRFRSDNYVEDQRLDAGGHVVAVRTKNGRTKTYERDFALPVVDFISGLALASELGARSEGCTVLYNDGRAFTVWARRVGSEKVEVGADDRRVKADRFELRYGSDRSKKVEKLHLWVSSAAPHMVLRAESDAALSPVFVLREHTRRRG